MSSLKSPNVLAGRTLGNGQRNEKKKGESLYRKVVGGENRKKVTEKEDSLCGLIDLGLYFSKMLFMNFVALTSEREFPNLQGRV